MKATFALLPDLATQNAMMALGWDLHIKHGTGIDVRKLPPHISLKQPFDAPELPELLVFMEKFASSIQKLEVEFAGAGVWPWPSASDPTSGILTLKVKENPHLSALHNRLNAEIAHEFGERSAAFDGETYEFHMTIAAGGPSMSTYQDITADLHNFPDRCTLESIALFVYNQPKGSDEWAYTTYRVIPLT